MQNRLAALTFWSMLVVVLASILFPRSVIAWMRDNWSWFNSPMLLIERVESPANLVHVVLFLLLGAAARIGMPHWGFSRVVVALLLLGIGTELAQFVVPGRHPRISDTVIDVLAGASGWALMSGAIFLWPRRAKS